MEFETAENIDVASMIRRTILSGKSGSVGIHTWYFVIQCTLVCLWCVSICACCNCVVYEL